MLLAKDAGARPRCRFAQRGGFDVLAEITHGGGEVTSVPEHPRMFRAEGSGELAHRGRQLVAGFGGAPQPRQQHRPPGPAL